MIDFFIRIGIIFFLFYICAQSIFDKYIVIDRIKEYSVNRAADLSAQEFDFVIVGAGSSGAVLANRLSHPSLNYTVALLEAGLGDNQLFINMPVAFGKVLRGSRDWTFYTEQEPELKNRRVFWPRGKVLGGCSSINANIYIRGPPLDYDEWEELGNKGWSYKDMLPYFKKSENNQRSSIDPEYHGFNGELFVSDIQYKHETMEAAIESISSVLNVSKNDDFNGKNLEGVGYVQRTIYKGKRWSTAEAFLGKEVLQRKNLFVKTHAHVTSVIFDSSKRAVAVEYVNTITRQKITVRAKKEVILAAGAVQTPQLLLLSGIGPEEQLKKFEIPIVVNSPGVGKNLQDHIMSEILVNSTHPNSLNQAHTIGKFLQWFMHGEGQLTSNVGEVVAFAKTSVALRNNLSVADVQFYASPGYYTDNTVNRLDGNGVGIGGIILRPKSAGYIELKSRDPFDAPKIVANYLQDKEDVETLVEILKTSRKITETAPLKNYLDKEYKQFNLEPPKTDEEWLEWARHQAHTLYHPTGTAKMGPKSDPLAVVDSKLKVYGVKGLRVVDCSIMPLIVRANTNAPVIAIAEKAADDIINEYKQ